MSHLYPLKLILAAGIEPATKIAHSPPPQAAGQPERFLQHVSPVLGRPDQVVQGIVDGMGCASEDHVAIVTPQADLGSGHRARYQDRSFPPAASSGAA